MAPQFLEVVPSQIYFRDVLLGKVYSKLLAITNRSNTLIEAVIRPSSSDRYSVHPKQLKLKGGQTCDVELRLKVTRFAQTEKAVHQGQRDAIHIKTLHFADQQFYVYFFLDPSQLTNTGKGPPRDQNVPASLITVRTMPSQGNSNLMRHCHQQDAPGIEGETDAAITIKGKEYGSIRLHAPGSPPSPVHKTAPARVPPGNVHQGVPVATFGHSHIHDSVQKALTEERNLQEQRNRKVLQLLQEKDGMIHELQVERGRLNAEIHSMGQVVEEAKQATVTAQRSSKAAEAQLKDLRDELAIATDAWQKKLSMREKELVDEVQVLHMRLKELGSQKATHSMSTDEELKSLQKQLHQVKMDGIDNMEQKLRADADNEALKRKLSAADQLVLELQSQLKDVNASSAALVQSLQAEHQETVAHLETRMVELQDLQLRTDAHDTEQENMGPPAQQTLSDEARKTLQDRIAVLEAANATLENALLSSHDDQQPDTNLTRPSPTTAQGEHGEPIDAELGARAQTSCRENLMAEDSLSELQRLQYMVSNQQKELTARQVRIAKLESLHKLAQDSALACESELVSCQRALVFSRQQNDDLVSELQNSKLLAAQLNSRVTDLSATCAATQSDNDISLNEVKQLHATEIAGLKKQATDLLEELSSLKRYGSHATNATKAVGPDRQRSEDVGMSLDEKPVFTPAIVRDEQWSSDPRIRHDQQVLDQTCTDAETVIASLQQQLMIAEQAHSKAEASRKATARAMELQRCDLEQMVRTTAEDGRLRIKLLEETVQRLSARGDQQAELARLSSETSKLLRINAKLKSDLMFGENRVQTLTNQLAAAAVSVPASSLAPEWHGVSPSFVEVLKNHDNVQATQHFHKIVARLVERAESAEIELATVRTELAQLKATTQQSAAAHTNGSNAKHLVSRVLEVKTRDLEHDIILKKYGANSPQEAMELQETKILQLHNSLAEAERDLATSRRRVCGAEEKVQTVLLDANEGMLAQLKELRQQATSAKHRASAAERQKQDALDRSNLSEAAFKAAKDEAGKKQLEIDAARAHIATMKAELEAIERSASEAAATLKQKLCHAEALASERAMQLCVLTDTVEALQSSQHSDCDQRIVNLTAQLVASRGCEASQRSRSNCLHVANERCLRDQVILEHAKDTLEARCLRAEADVKSLQTQREEAHANTERLQQQLQKAELEVLRFKDETQSYQQRLSSSESELQALHKELTQSSSRHFEMQQELRQEMKEAIQHDIRQLLSSLPHPPYLQEFCNKMQEHCDHGEKAAAECASQETAMARVQELVITADKERCIATTELRIAQDEVAELTCKLLGIERANEVHQQRASMYAYQLYLKTSQMEDAAQQAQAQMKESKDMLNERIESLLRQLMHAQAQLKDVTKSLQSASESGQAQRQSIQELSASLRKTKARLDCASGERDALKVQLAGHSTATSTGMEEARAARDAEIKDYICSHVIEQLKTGNESDQLTILARNIAAVKLSESQLLADLAASEKRCDMYIISAKHLETELARYQRHERSSDTPSAPWLHTSCLIDFKSTAELQHQISCQDQELHTLRCECVELRQTCERQRLKMQSLENDSDVQKEEINLLKQQSDSRISAACRCVQAQSMKRAEALETDLRTARQCVESLQTHITEKEAEWQGQLDDCKAKMEQAVQDSLGAQAAKARQDEHETTISHLAEELSKSYAEMSALQSKVEIQEGSIKLLGSGLAAIERRCTNAPAHEDSSKAAYTSLTKQILQSNMAQADAHRRLKVAAREALSYQQRLAEQSKRIQELRASRAGVRPAARRRCVSADRCTTSIKQEVGDPESYKQFSSANAVSLAGAQARETEGVMGQLGAHVHCELAQKQAQIDLLKHEISSATSSHGIEIRPISQNAIPLHQVHGSKGLMDQVGKCVAILSRTLGVKKPSASDDHCQHSEPESLGDRLENLCIRLAGQIEPRGADDHTLENSTTSRSDEQRLLESQGHVISSLTLRLESTVQQLVAAQQENSRLRERLRVLRVSIGDDGPAELENAPPFLDVSVAGVLTAEDSCHVSHGAEIQGLAVLLQSHLDTILQHQRQLTEALEVSQWHSISADGTAVSQHVLLQPLQQSARELAAMEATLHVLRYGVHHPDRHSKGCVNREYKDQSATLRKPLQPLADPGQPSDSLGPEEALCIDDVQAKQNGSHSEELDRDLASARIRVRELEHRCRNLKRSADEAAILQSQLEQTSQECTEWQQRFTNAKQEMQRSRAAAMSSKLEMENRIHELQLVVTKDKSAMESQIAQLDQQVNVLESDKAAALQKVEHITTEMVQANQQANSKDHTVNQVQQELSDQQHIIENLESELVSTRKSVETEKQERVKLLESLRGTIEQVRAAGQEEEHLQCELSKLTALLAQERHLRQQCEEEVLRCQENNQQLENKLCTVSKELLDSQSAAKHQALMAQRRLLEVDNQVHSLHEQLDMAESAFSRRLDDLGNSVISVSEHLQLPNEMIEEIEALDENLKLWGASFEAFQTDFVKATKSSCQRGLEAERMRMQKELIDLQAQLQDCQASAESESFKLRKEWSMAKKEAELARSEVDASNDRVVQLEKQVSDQAVCDEADRKEADARHREQLRSMQEGHKVVICSMHSASKELQVKIREVHNENTALLERVKAAENFAEATAKESSQLESSMRADVQRLQERHADTVMQMRLKLDQTQNEFREYQQAKHQEICGLDARIRELLTPQQLQECRLSCIMTQSLKSIQSHDTACGAAGNATDKLSSQTFPPADGKTHGTSVEDCMLSMTAPAAPPCSQTLQDDRIRNDPTSVGTAVAHDAILAAKREEEFEKILRKNAETDLAEAQRNLCQERMHSQELQRQLKKSREQGQASSKLMEQLKQKEHQTDVLQEKISHVQASLKECRDELGRKSLRLKELQGRVKQDAAADQDLQKECEAHKVTTCKLEHARRALSRKSDMITQLKQAISKSEDCPSQSKRQSGLVSQIKDLQAALARKDEVLKKMRESKDACKQLEAQLVQVHETNAIAEGKLKSDIQRRNTLLIAAKAESDRLKAELQSLKHHQQHSNTNTAGRCQLVNPEQAQTQSAAQALLDGTVALCRLLLRSLAYMRSGSINLCDASLAAQASSKMPGNNVLRPDDIAQLVGLSVNEVADLLSTPTQDVTSVVAGGSAIVIHIAKLLTAAHGAVCQVGRSKSVNSDPSGVEGHLSALIAVLETELKKSENALDSCIAAMPVLAQACVHNPEAPEVLQDRLQSAPNLYRLTDELDVVLMSSIQFQTDTTEECAV